MVVYYFEEPELQSWDESSISAIIRNECTLKAFYVKCQFLFIGEDSFSVSYSEFFTKTLQCPDIVMDFVGEFPIIDVLIGFARDEEKDSELILSTKDILYRRIESIDEDLYRDISCLVDLSQEGIVEGDLWFLIDEGHHGISLVVDTLF